MGNNKKIFKSIVKISAGITFISLTVILIYILLKGIPNLKLTLFSTVYNIDNVSMYPALINTLIIIIISLAISIPLGVFTAIYLVEYASKNKKKLISIIRLSIDTLAGVPSIIYGLFGMLLFVNKLQLGYCILSGSLTLSIMILPLIIRASEESLISVDSSLREASYSLGASRSYTIFNVILPMSISGIINSVILSIGRIVGETAALIYTAGTVPELVSSILDSGRTLSVHMYVLSSEGFYVNEAYATAVVLILIVLILNMISYFIERKLGGNKIE